MTHPDGQADDKTPVEQAVEVLVYAPIGLLFEGASLLPQLVEKGKSQVAMARMIGKFAVQQGRGEATKVADRLQGQAAGLLDLVGNTLAPTPEAARTAPASPSTDASTSAAPAPAKRAARAGRPTPRGQGSGGSAALHAPALAIPDYDGLSASQVVNRLAGLTPVELEAVRAYEAANRGRKTILSKIAQLQTA